MNADKRYWASRQTQNTWGWHTRLSIKPSAIGFLHLFERNHPSGKKKGGMEPSWQRGVLIQSPACRELLWHCRITVSLAANHHVWWKASMLLGPWPQTPYTQTCTSMLIFKQGNCSPNRADQIKANVYKGGFEWRCEILFVYVETLFFKHHCYI